MVQMINISFQSVTYIVKCILINVIHLKNYDWTFEIQASIVFLYAYLFQLWYLQYNLKRLAIVTQIYPIALLLKTIINQLKSN